ncbi:ABC transporter substrate-binding protein [Cryptosporangium arvum]|uniref:ABC-type Fe3+-hydroxamate transport system, periplasmic component n=1 Tax=Cryptosporangium arvum DSM 44712 TaxID=927661 RepID=A0A011AET4_9ACTN|nr:ABC transporter substrate-binding protein [Cryptosporangium arvum]EXG80551.1 ABC-type Fe3+-hydroxamate transport system, periplasmic component [Cryptosporangium arvum DSM 44712]
MRLRHGLVASLLLLTGCGGAAGSTAPDSGYPISVTNCDRSVSVGKRIERAVSISQPASELLLSLGLEDRMAGTASWSDPVLPALATANAKVPRIAKDFPSFERLLEDEPDFVYTTFAYTYTAEGVADRARFDQVKIPTYLSSSECTGQDATQTRALTIDDLYREITDLATLFDVPDRGTALVDSLKKRMATAVDARDVSLAWWYSSTKAPYIAGCCGTPGLVTAAVGAKNAFADGKQLWPETGWESILDRDPDVLVLADLTRGDDGDSAAAKIAFLESDPVARRLTAVKNKRYVVLSGSDMDPGVRTVQAVEKVSAGLTKLGYGTE